MTTLNKQENSIHECEVNAFSVPWTRTKFPLRLVYWKMTWFVNNFLQNFHMEPKVNALSRSLFRLFKIL